MDLSDRQKYFLLFVLWSVRYCSIFRHGQGSLNVMRSREIVTHHDSGTCCLRALISLDYILQVNTKCLYSQAVAPKPFPHLALKISHNACSCS